ncbi:MAG TPA: FAD-binding protein, partial [Gemmatimonadales bacterium]|nr:FAD-binding protein [Gemmatimonadales bacterium]
MPVLLTDPRLLAAYSEGAGVYRVLPRAVAIPSSPSEVTAIMQHCAAERLSLVPRGAGSGMAGGNVGRGVVLDMSQGFRELEIDPKRR